LKVAKGNPLIRILKDNIHLIDIQWTEDKQVKLKTQVEGYTLQGASGAWSVHRWWLVRFPLLLEDTEDRNDISGQWNHEWPLDTWGNSPIFRWLREKFLPMLVKEPAEYPETVHDNESREALLPESDRNDNALPCAPP